MIPGSCRIVVSGEELWALPDRSLWWPKTSTLFIADLHLGKAAAFRAEAVAVPGGTTTTDLARISTTVEMTGASRLIVLGDLWHAKTGLAPQTVEKAIEWRRQFSSLDFVLVEGNHDRKTGLLPQELGVSLVPEPHPMTPFTLVHDPRKGCEPYVLAGHIHPCVRLEGRARQSMRLPCFWFGPEAAVLPAYGSFTGCARVLPGEEDRVLVICEGRVLEVG